jgi:hypothetical protein
VKQRLLTGVVLFVVLFGGRDTCAFSRPLEAATTVSISLDRYYRTELYMGRSKPGGGLVTETEWQRFLAEVVTPRFPDGFTILNGTGQYREKSGKIISEPSQVLVFLYQKGKRKSSRAKIEEIRTAYIKQFAQESVLRLDFKTPVQVSF